MSHYRPDPMVSAILQATRLVLEVNDWHKEIGRENQYTAAKPRRRYTNDDERMFIELNNAAHYATVVLKMGVPISVGEDEIWSAVWAMLIGCVEQPAEVGLNP